MKKSVKIITLALSVLLLIGAVIGITVSAETEDRISIVHKNLSYEGAIRVLYALDVDALEDGESVALVFTDKDGNFLYENGLSKQTITLNGKTYPLALSNGISPKDMRKTVCATAVIKDANGVVVASSETCEYSIWQYAINRFEKSPSEDQLALYTTMLNYGASVQKVLMDSGKYKETELLAAGGYANEYCGIQVNTYVDLEKNADGAVKYYAPGTEVALGASKTLGESVFDCYRDADNKQVGVNGWNKETVTAEKPGKTVYSSQYITTGATPITFDSTSLSENNVAAGSCTNNFTKDETVVKKFTYTDTTDGNAYTISVDTRGHLNVVDGVLVHERAYQITDIKDADGKSLDKTPDGKRVKGATLGRKNANTYPEIGEIKMGSELNFLNQTEENMSAITYRTVFEFDIFYNEKAYSSGSQGWFMNKASGGDKLWGFNIGYTSAGGLRLTIANGGDNTKVIASHLPLGEWLSIRFEYYDLADHEMAVFVYVNGELCPSPYAKYWSAQSQVTTNDAYAPRFLMNFLYDAAKLNVKYDNFYFATETYGYGTGHGYEANNNETVTYDYYDADGNVIENVTSDSTYGAMDDKLGFYSLLGTSFGGKVTDKKYARIETAEDGNRYYLSGSSSGNNADSIGFVPDSPLIGDKYIFETDFIWYGTQDEAYAGGDPIYLRFYDSVGYDQHHQDIRAFAMLYIKDPGKSSPTFNIRYDNSNGVDIPKGEWVNLRIVITPESETTTKLELLVNGRRKIYVTAGLPGNSKATTATFDGVYFMNRSYAKCYNYSYALDNTYVGTGNKGSYYRNADLTGYRYNFTSGETFEVYDPENAPNGIHTGNPPRSDNNNALSITSDGKLMFSSSMFHGASFPNKGDTKVNVGDTLVFETDFNLSGVTKESSTDQYIAFVGFTSDNVSNTNMAWFRPEVIKGDPDHYKFGSAILEKGVTYNIRIEYTYSLNDNGSINKIANLFIDNVASGTLSLTFGTGFTFDNVKGFAYYNRADYAISGKTTILFDNVYFGIIRAETETPAE